MNFHLKDGLVTELIACKSEFMWRSR